MKKLYLAATLLLAIMNGQVFSQENTLTRNETDPVDSVSIDNETLYVFQKEREKEQLQLLKEEVKRTKEEAREAKKIERRERAEAREAEKALKAEKKAQRARQKADRLARKRSGSD
jgi:hypothetical protein